MNNRWPYRARTVVVACAATLYLTAAPARADDEAPIKTPQPATVLLVNGNKWEGTLLKATGQEVQFQPLNQTGLPVRYKAAEVKAIVAADDTYVYNRDKAAFEGLGVGPPPVGLRPKDSADPSQDDKQTVIAEGVGADGEEALKDAFRAAVRQVVGTVVDTETLVANDQVISDKVLIYSDGIIKGGYKELSRTQEKGLVRIKILATVVRRSVALKLKEAHVTTRNVDGKDVAARGRWSSYVLDCDRAKSFAAAEGELEVAVSLQDDKGAAVAEDEFPLEYGEAVSSLAAPHWLLVRGQEGVVVTPFCYASYFAKRNFAPSLPYKRDIAVSIGDLSRIKEVKCRVIFRPAKADATGP